MWASQGGAASPLPLRLAGHGVLFWCAALRNQLTTAHATPNSASTTVVQATSAAAADCLLRTVAVGQVPFLDSQLLSRVPLLVDDARGRWRRGHLIVLIRRILCTRILPRTVVAVTLSDLLRTVFNLKPSPFCPEPLAQGHHAGRRPSCARLAAARLAVGDDIVHSPLVVQRPLPSTAATTHRRRPQTQI